MCFLFQIWSLFISKVISKLSFFTRYSKHNLLVVWYEPPSIPILVLDLHEEDVLHPRSGDAQSERAPHLQHFSWSQHPTFQELSPTSGNIECTLSRGSAMNGYATLLADLLNWLQASTLVTSWVFHFIGMMHRKKLVIILFIYRNCIYTVQYCVCLNCFDFLWIEF